MVLWASTGLGEMAMACAVTFVRVFTGCCNYPWGFRVTAKSPSAIIHVFSSCCMPKRLRRAMELLLPVNTRTQYVGAHRASRTCMQQLENTRTAAERRVPHRAFLSLSQANPLEERPEHGLYALE